MRESGILCGKSSVHRRASFVRVCMLCARVCSRACTLNPCARVARAHSARVKVEEEEEEEEEHQKNKKSVESRDHSFSRVCRCPTVCGQRHKGYRPLGEVMGEERTSICTTRRRPLRVTVPVNGEVGVVLNNSPSLLTGDSQPSRRGIPWAKG